jgi:acyl-CoA thioesterase
MKSAELSPERTKEISNVLRTIPYAKLLGIELVRVMAGEATLALEIKEELKRNNGIAHGGAISSLIDTATAFAVISLLETPQRATTVDLTINFLRPISEGRATATAKIIREGRRIVVVAAEVHDDAGKLLATALSTYIKD